MRRTSDEGARVVEDTWFARYPRPKKVVTDNGPEFKLEFIAMVKKNGAVHRYSSPRNPQCNSMIEQTHQAIGQVLRTILVSRDPKSVSDGIKVISETLSTAMHALRCSVQSANAYLTPGSLAFKRVMFLDIPFYADILAMQ
ncbi:Retrotransposon protein [Seminavis robusta]|uniref:Retrotransposon protein n=1 Tax=Seminavis robusta TaxID=568900 RepID=A0A9N8HEZ6_9STRA|nr:Retrotransposon protein [Seminavis robusta]|eukprot:Sro326_g117920.1 Retrotransposon protein (141) ;mRNA; r:758-1180